MSIIRVAQLQLPVLSDKKSTLALVSRTVEEVARNADFIALPEMFCCPYQTGCFPEYAEPERGYVWEICSKLAKSCGVYISAGSMPEKDESGLIYNTAYVFDRNGVQIAKHRKMHLFDIDVKGGQCFKESDTLTPGNSVTTFDTEFGMFGLCICYDFRFPELARLMVLRGASVIVVPGAFNMTTGPAHWEITFRSQGLSNQVYTVGTAPARDLNASYHSWGHSIVADPWGRAISQMDENQGVKITELNMGYINEVREQLPLLKHRRTDIYAIDELTAQAGNP